MTQEKITGPELRHQLAQFFGTENYYTHSLFSSDQLTYTDGVKFWVEKVGGYWFLDIVVTEFIPYISNPQNNRGPYSLASFCEIELTVYHDGTALILLNDGGEETHETKRIPFTDCPEGVWKFWLENGVMILPSEH
jgi:hypothetical protein